MIDSGKTISNSHALLIKIYIQETNPILLIFRYACNILIKSMNILEKSIIENFKIIK